MRAGEKAAARSKFHVIWLVACKHVKNMFVGAVQQEGSGPPRAVARTLLLNDEAFKERTIF